MKVSIHGFRGPLAQATEAELARRGHTVDAYGTDAAVVFPSPGGEVTEMPAAGRLVLRSHAYAYGADPKNPGLLTEDRVSLLPENSPERRWLRMEQAAAVRNANYAAVRLTNVLAPEEGDDIVKRLASSGTPLLAGHDPNLQFISVADAARALADACQSPATGIFNATGTGAIPLKKAFRAAGTTRLPIPEPLAKLAGIGDPDSVKYNWTVCGERAAAELGFEPSQSTPGALAEFVRNKSGARPDRLQKQYDDFGLDVGYIMAWSAWFSVLRNVYWRIEVEGMDQIPAQGKALFVSNHRGFMPLDAVMHLYTVMHYRKRIIRFLITHTLVRKAFLCNFLAKLGGVIANMENAKRLLDAGDLVGIFPEGIRGTFQPYKKTLQLRDFSRSGYIQMAIENQAPICPVAVVGHSEIFPILARIDWSYITRDWGWPYFPIAPMFPLAPVPLPSKWHIRVLPPVGLQGLKPPDAAKPRVVTEFSRYIQDMLQTQILEMAGRRKHIFWGNIFDGTAPPIPAFRPAASRAATEVS
ncbi:MAG: 1-acyl-sn-glycerol-3-phosphate acyltransferase [Bryobacteraceae bacterium]